ncbi:sensor histidine kinase, partial [Acinetobacter baumannii]|uniref:sensor histidine kinase n=1 Tax=Acinetobacter baumannii TaxID=470 RepID=UPI003211F753
MLHKSLQMANEAIKAKSQFLASMSHDIRTPMNAIIGMANIALEDIDNKEQIKESLDVIQSSSESLLAIINDILDVNRMESGKADLNNKPFALLKACAEI